MKIHKVLIIISGILILILGSLYLKEKVRNARLIEENNSANNNLFNTMKSPVPQSEIERKETLAPNAFVEDNTKSKDTFLEIEKCRVLSENDALVGEMERFAETFNQLIDENVSIPDEQAKKMWEDWEKSRRNEIYEDCLNAIQ